MSIVGCIGDTNNAIELAALVRLVTQTRIPGDQTQVEQRKVEIFYAIKERVSAFDFGMDAFTRGVDSSKVITTIEDMLAGWVVQSPEELLV